MAKTKEEKMDIKAEKSKKINESMDNTNKFKMVCPNMACKDGVMEPVQRILRSGELRTISPTMYGNEFMHYYRCGSCGSYGLVPVK